MVCKACETRGKIWTGGDPKCGFLNGPFDGINNWKCATANHFRRFADCDNGDNIHHRITSNNQQYLVIDVSDVDFPETLDEDDCVNPTPDALWVGWYKDRGRTEALWLMFDYLPPRAPTEDECVKILEWLSVHHPLVDD